MMLQFHYLLDDAMNTVRVFRHGRDQSWAILRECVSQPVGGVDHKGGQILQDIVGTVAGDMARLDQTEVGRVVLELSKKQN